MADLYTNTLSYGSLYDPSDQMIFVQRRKCVPFSIYTVFFLYEKVKKIVLVAKRPSSV